MQRVAAVAALWFVNGLTTASVATRLPDIMTKTGLSEGGLGIALAGQSLGLILVTAFVTTRLVRRFGARPVAIATGLLYSASILLPGLPVSLELLFLAFFAVGAFNAPLDVTMASLGGGVERERGKPTMSSLEAFFVIGQVAGSLLGLLFTAVLDVPLETHLQIVAFASVALVAVASFWLPRRGEEEAAKHETGPLFTRRNVMLAAIAFASLWCEGAVVDWVAIYYRDELGAGDLALVGLVAFVVAVLASLLLGGRLAKRWGKVAVTRVGASMFVVGILIAALAPSVWLATIGLAVAGLGLPNAHPFALSVADRLDGARALALVQGVSYVGLVAAKPVIGGIAEVGSLRLALGTTAVLGIAILIGSSALRDDKPVEAS